MTRSTPRNQANPNTHNKKRKANNNINNNNSRRSNPRRGGPGILLTCETGRDNRAKREGVQILEHYWNIQQDGGGGGGDDENKDNNCTAKLSLEDEIQMFKKSRKNKDSGLLVEYDTGCRGTVSLMCVLPACALVPPMERDITKATEEDSSNELSNKKQKLVHDAPKEVDVESKVDEVDSSAPVTTTIKNSVHPRLYDPSKPAPWDPLAVVYKVITDIQAKNTDAPSSRFISRMIPIQATCYATLEEITHMANVLLDKYLSTSNDPKTFAVLLKRRNCSLVTKDQIIDCIYNLVVAKKPNYTVKLKNADVTIVVEICKTLCGISVIDDCAGKFQNFNLHEFREKANGGSAEDGANEKEQDGNDGEKE